MVGSTNAAGNSAILCKRRAAVVVYHTCSVAVPLPVADREHTVEVEPVERLCLNLKLYTLVQGVKTSHIDKSVDIINSRSLGHSLVEPLCPVAVYINGEPLEAVAIANLQRHNLLVLSVRVGYVACHRCKEGTVVELRSTADVASVEEHVVLVGDVVVGTTLYSEADVALGVRLCVLLVVEQAVVTPVRGVGERA